jgi:hypothetical protein
MKRALLIAGGTVGGLGAVLAITPPQFTSTQDVSGLTGSLGGGTSAAHTTAPAATQSATQAAPTPAASKAVATKKATATKSAKATTKASASATAAASQSAPSAPTASAILGDLVAVARHAAYSTVGYGESDYADLDIAPIGAVKSQFFVRLHVADKSGVLASIAQTFASENVSIQTVRQSGLGADAELIVVTHAASEDALDGCVEKLKKMDIVSKVESVIRVEGAPA